MIYTAEEEHVFTDDSDETCNVCGYNRIGGHTYTFDIFRYDGTNHWSVCACGEGQTGSVTPHSMTDVVKEYDGHGKACSVCDYVSSLTAHSYEYIPAEEATLPLRWLRQLPLCGPAADERLQAIIHRQQVSIFPPDRAEKYRSFFIAPRKEVQTKMPNPHFDISIVQRSKGKSAVAGAAYQSGERLFSEYDQKFKDYRNKQGVIYTEIMLPANAPPEYADRETLWNAAEEVEKQWNSQLARRFVLTFPREIPCEHYPQMVKADWKPWNPANLDDLGLKKLPTVKNLQVEYAELLTQKKAAYAEYRAARDEMKELLIHKANVEQILGKETENDEKKNEHERG